MDTRNQGREGRVEQVQEILNFTKKHNFFIVGEKCILFFS